MVVRPYQESDLDAIINLHRKQGFDYLLPSPEDCPVSCIIEEGGNITHAVFLRTIAETYWLFDPNSQWKRQRLGRLLVLHKEVEVAAAMAGIGEVQAFIPPSVLDRKMELTIIKLGWIKSEWPCYSHRVAPALVEV
jgi:hypothetical protein